MELGIKGKVALVAGASSGLGRAIAEALSAEGVKVAICARRIQVLKQVGREIEKKTGAKVLPVKCDVTKKQEIQKAVATISKALGAIQILVCNAGGPPTGRFEQLTDENWERGLRLNLKSTIWLCSTVLPQMQKKNWGRIIALTSVSALQPIDNLMLSNTSRAGVHGFIKTLANEIAADGITANCICPGYTLTDRLKDFAAELKETTGQSFKKTYTQWRADVPAKKLGKPEDVGALAAFLASQRAGYITGIAINIDGGLVKSI